MKRNLKRAFTIVELVIVIAVLAILAAILIPTFVNVAKQAKLSADQQTVYEMNVALASDEVINGKPDSVFTVYTRLEEYGINAADSTPLSSGCLFFWSSENNRVVLAREENGSYTVLYPTEYENTVIAEGEYSTETSYYETDELKPWQVLGMKDLRFVAESGGVYYTDLKEAIRDGGTVTLLRDVETTTSAAPFKGINARKFDSNNELVDSDYYNYEPYWTGRGYTSEEVSAWNGGRTVWEFLDKFGIKDEVTSWLTEKGLDDPFEYFYELDRTEVWKDIYYDDGTYWELNADYPRQTEEELYLYFSKDTTLNLNGYTVTLYEMSVYLDAEAYVTIKNGTLNYTCSESFKSQWNLSFPPIQVNNRSSLELDSVTLNNPISGFAIDGYGAQRITLKGDTVLNGSIHLHASWEYSDMKFGGDVVIEGGSYVKDGGTLIQAYTEFALTITGGTFTCDKLIGISSGTYDNVTVTVTGGTFAIADTPVSGQECVTNFSMTVREESVSGLTNADIG